MALNKDFPPIIAIFYDFQFFLSQKYNNEYNQLNNCILHFSESNAYRWNFHQECAYQRAFETDTETETETETKTDTYLKKNDRKIEIKKKCRNI